MFAYIKEFFPRVLRRQNSLIKLGKFHSTVGPVVQIVHNGRSRYGAYVELHIGGAGSPKLTFRAKSALEYVELFSALSERLHVQDTNDKNRSRTACPTAFETTEAMSMHGNHEERKERLPDLEGYDG